jgi:hypothetical protein
MLIVAEKARLYDKLMAERQKQPMRKAKPAPRTLRPGKTNVQAGAPAKQSRKQSEFRRQKDRARQSGSMRDAGAAIGSLLGIRRR